MTERAVTREKLRLPGVSRGGRYWDRPTDRIAVRDLMPCERETDTTGHHRSLLVVMWSGCGREADQDSEFRCRPVVG